MRRGVIAGALVLALASRASATPSSDLQRGIDAYKTKDYYSAKKEINALLYPKVEFTRVEETVEAYIVLGAALWHLGERQRAVAEFERALELDISISITTNLYSEDVIKVFEDTKARVKDKLDIKRKKLEQEERDKRIAEYLKTVGVYETHSFGYNFVPFGTPQFQNGHREKGAFFAAAQGITLGTSVGCWLYLAATYGLDAKVPLEDGPRVRRLQQIEVGAGVAFFLLYGIGLYDGLRHFTPNRVVKGDKSKLPPDLRDSFDPAPVPKPKPKTSFRDRLRIAPMVTPESVGIGIGWESD